MNVASDHPEPGAELAANQLAGCATGEDRGQASRSKTFTRNSVVGKVVSFHFCPKCGSTVFWEPERVPHLIGVAVGAFGDPSFPQPEQSVFTTSKRAWAGLPGEMRAFAAMPSTASPKD